MFLAYNLVFKNDSAQVYVKIGNVNLQYNFNILVIGLLLVTCVGNLSEKEFQNSAFTYLVKPSNNSLRIVMKLEGHTLTPVYAPFNTQLEVSGFDSF